MPEIASPTLHIGPLIATTGTFSGLVTANAGLTVASGQTLTLTGATVVGLTVGAANVGAGTFPAGAFLFQGTVGGITTLTATTLAGTLSTAAQPNVTSLGTIAALVAGTGNFSGVVTIASAVVMTGIQVAGFGGVQTDYTLDATTTTLLVELTASTSLRSITGGAEGRKLNIINKNTSGYTLGLNDEDGSGMAANRFALTGDKTLPQDGGIALIYIASRWRSVAIAL